jgi:quinol monooxygenase YgiN
MLLSRRGRGTSRSAVLAEMGGALNSRNCSSRRSCRGQTRQQGFDEADFCVLAAQSATFVNAPAGCAAATKDQEAEVTVCFVLHRVADYDAWRRVYDRVPDVQRERGVTGQAVYRAEGDPNNLLVMQEFRSSQEAHSFFDKPQFREVMEYAGVDVDSLRLEFYDPA